MKHNEPFEDDGRTVADMSGIEHDSIWLPRRRKQGHTPAQQPQQAADRPWEEDPQLTGKERLWAILGALKATLLICGVYLLGLLALLASLVAPLLTDAVLAEITFTGSLLIIGIGLNILGLTKLRVLNMMPAVLFPILLCRFL